MKYERIWELRQKSGLSQEKLGEEINVPQRAYSYYENGERMIPPEVLIRLADFHNTSIDYLLGRTDERAFTPVKKRR